MFFLKIIVAGSVAVGMLSLLNLALGYTGVHIDNKIGATDYVWESNQLRSNTSEGFAWLQVDEFGFNNTKENTEKAMSNGVDILLMGSSHMEAMQASKDENVGALLNAKLSKMNTYNIGMSGHDVYRIFDNVWDAVKVYQPEEYLVMEIDEIKLDIVEMQDVIDGKAKKIPSYDSGIIYHMQKIPAVKWVYQSIDNWVNQSKSAAGNVLDIFARENDDVDISVYTDVLSDFLSLCVEACKQTGCTPVVFYHQQADIQSDGAVKFETDKQYLNLFEETCKQNGIVFVDMSPIFAREYEENQVLPHGFINSYVGSGHVNAAGHRMIADKISEIILELEEANNGTQ